MSFIGSYYLLCKFLNYAIKVHFKVDMRMEHANIYKMLRTENTWHNVGTSSKKVIT
jgi:hypothetical protein